MDDKIRLGISACLAGERVRYDGRDRLDRYLTETLGQYVDFVPVCPEVECGLGVPREGMRLVGDPATPRLVTINTGLDHTERMRTWAAQKVRDLEKERLCGFIFKSKSPSSGMERVKVYTPKAMAEKTGVGLFAGAFMQHFPLLPVEDDGRLHDPALRENFVVRVFVMKRWRDLLAAGAAAADLTAFHTRHKLLLLAHSPAHYRQLARLVAGLARVPSAAFVAQYQATLMAGLRRLSTRSKNASVLYHILGCFRTYLTAGEKQEMMDLVEQYRTGLVPLIVPLTMANHYVRKYDAAYLREQYYLNPHPLELQLRNHV